MTNLKLIDAAIAGYRPTLDEADNERLAFFRDLWGEQAAIVAEHPNAIAYEVPDADELRALSERALPVLSQHPADVPADILAEAAARIAGRMAERGSFDDETRASLARTNWERIVAASNVALAGADPSAYVRSVEGLLADDGFVTRSTAVGASAVSLALRALLEPIAQDVQRARRDNNADQPYPTRCPVCGTQAAVARVGGGGKGSGRARTLWCAQCGCAWDFERVRCARCGTQNQGHLHFYNVEGDDAHRIATCDECGGYIRTSYEDDGPVAALHPFAYEVEDVVMTRLDLIAYRQAAAAAADADAHAPEA